MRTAWMLLIALVCSFVLMSCLALTPEQEEKLDGMQQRMAAIHSESQVAAELIQRLWEKQTEVREKLKNNELTAKEAADLMVSFSAEMKEAVAHFNSLKAESQALYADYKELKDSGVPWYAIAGHVILGAASLWLGKKNSILGAGIKLMTKAIENGSIRDVDKAKLEKLSSAEIACLMKNNIKKRVWAGGNPEIEKAVLKLPG